MAAAASCYMLGPMRAYACTADRVSPEPAAVGVRRARRAVAACGLALLRCRRRVPAAMTRLGADGCRVAIVAGVWLLAVYALVFRHQAASWPTHDANALRTFTNLYFTLPALIAALIGCALVARRVLARSRAHLTVVVFACFSSTRSGSSRITSG